MFGELLFSFDSLKLGISYKAKKQRKQIHDNVYLFALPYRIATCLRFLLSDFPLALTPCQCHRRRQRMKSGGSSGICPNRLLFCFSASRGSFFVSPPDGYSIPLSVDGVKILTPIGIFNFTSFIRLFQVFPKKVQLNQRSAQ